MDEFLLFGLSVALGFCAWGYVCFHYVWPTINHRSLVSAARPILVLHLFRFVGLSFLVTGVVGPTLPRAFATPGAFGDLFAVVLAWLALFLLRRPGGVAALWAFNLWGAADLLFAFYGGLFGPDFHPSALGATFYIPTIYVPLLLCTHAMLFVLLMRPRTAADAPLVTAHA
jgi:hypothetical protein